MTYLFESEKGDDWFQKQSAEVSRSIAAFSDEQISTVNFDEWEQYYYSKYEAIPITLYEDHMEQTAEEGTVQKHNPFFTQRPYDKEYYDVPAYYVSYRIPYDGSPHLLQLQPSTHIMSRFPADNQSPLGEQCGILSITLPFEKQDLKDKPDANAYIRARFSNELRSYRQMIEYINADAVAYNQQLRRHILSCLQKRKEKASDFKMFCDTLNIPLKKSSGAPTTAPVTLKRIVREPPAAPKPKQIEREYSISDADYQNITNIVNMFCVSCEKTAVTYVKFEEEELRDTLLAMLNTHYDNATGETFRKKGKTDILIEFGNKAAYVAECKVWHGPKAFEDAIQQLFGYLTWRDCRVSLILFNKHNKDFSQIRKSIGEWVSEHAIRRGSTTPSMWQCTLSKGDSGDCVEVCIAVYDLYTN